MKREPFTVRACHHSATCDPWLSHAPRTGPSSTPSSALICPQPR